MNGQITVGDVPPRIYERLKQVPGYIWDETRIPFHTSYDNWHFFGTKLRRPSLQHAGTSQSQSTVVASTNVSTPRPTAPQHIPASDDGSETTSETHDSQAEHADLVVVAKVSHHPLREERAFQVCKSLSRSVDPEGRHIARPVDLMRLPSRYGDNSPMIVSIFESTGHNDLHDYIDFGPAWYRGARLGAQTPEDGQVGVPKQISIPSFLDFAVGAAQCLELLHHGQRIVHGEIRGDAFHYVEKTGQVRLVNFGSGLRSFEHGLTSTGWSSLSKEEGARTKLSYISPEQTGRWPSEPDSRTDIYSLGILFWILLTRSTPFDGSTPMEIVQGVLGRRIPSAASIRLDVPDVVGRVIQKMTCKAIEDRYHSVSGLKHDLLEIQKLLGQGDSETLADWKIASKDISSYFMLPTTMFGRSREHDEIVKIIEKVSRYHVESTRNGAQSMSVSTDTGSSNLSGANLNNFDGSESSASGDHSSSMSQKARPESIPQDNTPQQTSSQAQSSQSGRSHASMHSEIAAKPWEKKASMSVEKSNASSNLSIDGEGVRSNLGPTDSVGSLMNKNQSQKFHRRGRCEVISIAGVAGVGKSFLVQSVQFEARRRGYFASSKFDQAQKTPFGPVLRLLSSLFKQVFSESEEETQFHQLLKQYVRPAWPMLHKVLGLPEFLLGQPNRVRSYHSASPSGSSQLHMSMSGGQSSVSNFSLRGDKRHLERPPTRPSSRASVYSVPKGAQTNQDFLSQGSSTKSMRLVNTFLDVLRVFALHKFICVCLDDLQFADEESLELIHQLINSRMRLVIIVTYRPDEILPAKIASIIEPPNSEGIREMAHFSTSSDSANITALLGYIKNNGVGLSRIALSPFTENDINRYVAATLSRPASEIVPLAAVVQAKTGGNIFFMREMLHSLNRNKSIWYDYKTNLWNYDLDKIFQQYTSENHHAVLDCDSVTLRLNELPKAGRSILAWASLIGTTFSFAFIQRLLSGEFNQEAGVEERNSSSKTSYSQQELVAGLQSTIQAYIIIASEDDDRFRFTHDRYVQSSASLRDLTPSQMHFIISQNLLKYYSGDNRWTHHTATHICEAIDIINSRVVHKSIYRKLLFARAKTASESGARQTAIKCYVNCFALLQDDPWNDAAPDVYYEETLELHQRAAETYQFVGDFDKAMELLDEIFLHAKAVVDKTSAWIMLSRVHTQRGHSEAAFSSLTKALKALGVSVESDMTLEKCDVEFERLLIKISSPNSRTMTTRYDIKSSNLEAIGAVLSEAASAAFFSDTIKFYHMSLIMVSIQLDLGDCPQSGLGFVYLGMIAITRFSMLTFASQVGDIAVELLDRWGDNHNISVGRAIYGLFLGHIQRPLLVSFDSFETALERTIQAGDRVSTILNFGTVAALKFFGSEDVGELEAFCTYGCEEIINWQLDCRGGTMLLAVRQLCRSLRGKTNFRVAEEVMSDESHHTPTYLQWVFDEIPHADRPITFYQSMEIAPLFLYGHYSEAVRVGEACQSRLDNIWSARNTRFVMFFHGLAIAGLVWSQNLDPALPSNGDPGVEDMTGSAIAQLNRYKKSIVAWQVITDVNYLAWSKLLDAQISELEGKNEDTLKHYEDALDHASVHSFTFEEALGNYLLGGYFLRRGARRPAKAAVREALVLYRHLGAVGVADFIEAQHILLLRGITRTMRTADVGVQTDFASDNPDDGQFQSIANNEEDQRTRLRIGSLAPETKGDRIDAWQGGSARLEAGSGLPALDMLDLTSILESSQVISSILSIDQLLTTMCEIILNNCGGLASLAAIVVEEDDPVPGWSVVASGDLESGVSAYQPGLPLGETPAIAESVVLYCTRFRETVFLPNLIHDERFSNVSEAWRVRNSYGKSVICMPISHGDKPLLGILYLEGKPNCFTDRNLTVLGLLVNQIGISYSNALTMKAIKKVSASNVSMVLSQKQALTKAKEAESKAKVAEADALQSVELAEEAAKAKSIFLANVSHELRTPLNGLVGNSELLRASNLDAEQTEMADSIRVSADLLLTVINDILDFSKMEADKMQLFITAFKPQELLKEVVRSVSYSNNDKDRNVEIVQAIDIPPAMVFGDPVRVHQVLGNLIGNSLKFTQKGRITIGTKVESQTEEYLELKFWVKDTGIGIPPAQLQKLFKPFSQADASTARKYGGSGLGLSICKSLIESMMGGRIELDSVEGQGTTAWFTVKFPKAGEEIAEGDTPQSTTEVDESPSSNAIEPQETEGFPYNDFSHVPRADVRICIAEDNLINQKIAIQFMQKLGFKNIDAYDNGLLAVEGLRAKASEGIPYHLLLCDVQMPVCDGYEATKLIRKDSVPAVKGVLIIAMTASAIQGDREKCLQSGMNDYLAKPVRVQVLKKKLDQYLIEPPVSTPNLEKEALGVAKRVLAEASTTSTIPPKNNEDKNMIPDLSRRPKAAGSKEGSSDSKEIDSVSPRSSVPN